MALALALFALGMLGFIVARRIGYPYDLEWMEGSMLHHALRLMNGQPIYTAPSIDFIPHLYTPLYPMVVAGLGKLLGDVSYLIGRAVSVASFAGALVIGVLWAGREGRSYIAAGVALALPLAAFPQTGGFYDLVRCDSLQLYLTLAGAALAWYGRDRHATMAASAMVLVLSFFAKQTAAPLIAFIGIALLPQARRRKPILTFIAVGVIAFFGLVYAQNRLSGGWFWTYIFGLHQSHVFFGSRAFIETPVTLLRILGPALLLVFWALLSQILRRDDGESSSGFYFLVWLGVAGFFGSCLAFGTQWAHINALIPGIFFPSLAIGASAGRLLSRSAPRAQASGKGRAFRHALVWLLLIASLVPLLQKLIPRHHIPSAMDRRAGDAVIEKLRTAPGEVLIPFHPFYAHLAGKRVFLHRMGVWDVRGTRAAPVHGLDAAFAQQRFSRIIFDEKVEQTWFDWPEVLTYYRITERFFGPHVVEGAMTVPTLVLEPQPPVDRELQ